MTNTDDKKGVRLVILSCLSIIDFLYSNLLLSLLSYLFRFLTHNLRTLFCSHKELLAQEGSYANMCNVEEAEDKAEENTKDMTEYIPL